MNRRFVPVDIAPLKISLPLLAFVAGVVDVVCFFGLFHVFAAFITGTLIILVGEIAQSEGEYSLRFVIILVFAIGAVGWSFLVDLLRTWPLLLPAMLAVEGVFLLVFATMGTIAAPLAAGYALPSIILGMIAATAMSLQNVLMATSLRSHLPTTVMTGNTVHLLRSANIIFRNRLFANEEPAVLADAKTHLRDRLRALTSFTVGVLFGGAGLKLVGFAVVAVPAALLIAVAVIHAWRALQAEAETGAERH